MPTLTRQQHRLNNRQMVPRRDSYDSADIMATRVWTSSDNDYDLHKDVDFSLTKTPLRQASLNDLRIQPYSETLHHRYMSDEEESSPTPESDSGSNYDDDEAEPQWEPKETTTVEKTVEEPIEPLDLEAEVAIAVPIMAMGRPRLVDITNLAPMHKRKRSAEKPDFARAAMKNSVARIAVVNDENLPPFSDEALGSPLEGRLSKLEQASDVDSIPESWMPDEEELTKEDTDAEHYFPELELRNPLTYNDYDPYSLNPPKLSPRGLSSEGMPAPKKPGSIARARKNANATNTLLRRTNGRIGVVPGTTTAGNRIGIIRTLSKRQDSGLPREAKKPKMQARGATERQEMPMIPPFPVES